MALPTQIVAPGNLQPIFERELEFFRTNRILPRLWLKDLSLWPSQEFDWKLINSNLACLSFQETLPEILQRIAEVEDAATSEGLRDRVLVSFDSANLAARALLPFASASQGIRLLVLDTVAPSAIQRTLNEIDPAHTLFILKDKSGRHLENHALFLYFLEELRYLEIPRPNLHFVADTEANSYLASTAKVYGLRARVEEPPDILPGYCSAVQFGGLLMILSLCDREQIFTALDQMRRACWPSVAAESNPAVQLAALFSAMALSHRRYVLFFASPSLAPYTDRLIQLISGSLGKEGAGLIPIGGAPPRFVQPFENSAAFIAVTHEQDDSTDILELLSGYRSAGVPFGHIRLSAPVDFVSETFKWELSTVLACARLGLDPFDWPDAGLARRNAMDLLDKLSFASATQSLEPRLEDSGIQLFARGEIRRDVSTLNLRESLRSFFQLRRPESFLAVLAFLEQTPEATTALNEIRGKLTERLGLPVAVAFGPGGLQNYSHLPRSTTPNALYVVITASSSTDIPVPGTSYSFAQLQEALALGEFDALASSDRLAIRLHLLEGVSAGLANLDRALDQALKAAAGG